MALGFQEEGRRRRAGRSSVNDVGEWWRRETSAGAVGRGWHQALRRAAAGSRGVGHRGERRGTGEATGRVTGESPAGCRRAARSRIPVQASVFMQKLFEVEQSVTEQGTDERFSRELFTGRGLGDRGGRDRWRVVRKRLVRNRVVGKQWDGTDGALSKPEGADPGAWDRGGRARQGVPTGVGCDPRRLDLGGDPAVGAGPGADVRGENPCRRNRNGGQKPGQCCQGWSQIGGTGWTWHSLGSSRWCGTLPGSDSSPTDCSTGSF